MSKQIKADIALLVITVFWGASYMLTKVGLETLQPYNLTAVRFIIAFGISAAVFYRNIVKVDLKTLKYSLLLAVMLFGVFITMSFGLQLTSASNAGFLVSLSVVLIPILSFFFLKQKIEKKVLAGVCLAVVGIALLTLDTRLKIGTGDILCILCALLFAAHVVMTGVFTREVDSVALGVLQLGFVGLFSIGFSFVTETVRLPYTGRTWIAVLSLSILCTAVGYIVQATAQQYTSATHTGLILSLEPVFSAISAYIVLGEVMAPKGYIGAGLLLFSVLLAEVDINKKDA